MVPSGVKMKLKCQRCDKTVEAVLSKVDPHVKASCSICGKYIKFVSRKDLNMMQIFYQLQDEVSKKWGNGIVLQEYNGSFELVRANKSRNSEGTLYLKWGFPQGKNQSPSEKAIPWKLELGNAHEALAALQFFVRQLTGDKNQAPIDDDTPPF